MQQILRSIGAIVLAAFMLRACAAMEHAAAVQCRVDSVHQEDHVFTDRDGDPDYGVVVRATISNAGSDGTVVTTATLTTSDGTFQRTQSSPMMRNQSLSYEYDFPEPTLETRDIQSLVRCSPS